MDSWWELGEGIGFQSDRLETWRLVCAFCGEKGHFSQAFHAQKKKPNARKALNFDVYQCSNCAGFLHVLWSHSEYGGLYNYHVLPWPLSEKPQPSENWPDGMKKFWIQAHDSLRNENWDAATVMARSALQFVVREEGAKKGSLKQQIEDLSQTGVLHPLMKEWAHEVRLLANESAHPDPAVEIEVTPENVKDIVSFLDFLLLYLYDLPKRISNYRERKGTATP